MKVNMNISYFDNNISIDNENINAIEIENKKYFYRFIKDLYEIENIGINENINFFEDNVEKNINKKLKIFVNFFDFELNTKKMQTEIIKYIVNTLDEENKNQIEVQYKKMLRTYKNIINSVDIPLKFDEDINIESLLKILNIGINKKEELLDNIILLIDIEKVLKTNSILIFINLKQYLSRDELAELYKYAIYSQVTIILIDSQCYGGTLKYEKKLIIDENLDEFML